MIREKIVVVPLAGRDYGKHFQITEMSAYDAEQWAWRAFLLLSNAGVDLPEEVKDSGIAGLAVIGLRALSRVKYEDVKPLLDQMLECVKAIRDPKQHPELAMSLVATDIEEAQTYFWLREAVFELHTGFSVAAALSSSMADLAAARIISGTSTSPTP